MDRSSLTTPGAPAAQVAAFPAPPPGLAQAYRELHQAMHGSPEEKAAVGDAAALPRPWDPGSVTRPALRRELWEWLEAVAAWLNTQFTWDTADLIPPCWPQHPHLVQELAVLADQRRQAALMLTSDGSEDWLRYCLPAFTDRMRARLRSHCQDGHQPSPGRGRHAVYAAARQARAQVVEQDVAAAVRADSAPAPAHPVGALLRLVDPSTGELLDGGDPDDDPDDPDDGPGGAAGPSEGW